ncbi:hypothetical protein F383_33115 [Gossypium arboreum]|uniref:Uncharacterized protein n=1 Tax=Gossypium arboreum TaxID=29729 RepID=A0A0B0PNW1_GOSAR|nr:hypothetical protein F383_33115 [Gossypium arboreum]
MIEPLEEYMSIRFSPDG